MKKILGITLAAACALSCAVFGFTACSGEKDSDEVTEEVWVAAMSSEKALNVTMKATYSSETKETESGVTETEKDSRTTEAKTALEWYNGITTSSVYVKGNAYIYTTESETYTDSEGTETESATETRYEVFEEDAYSYVTKYTETGYEDEWAGNKYDLAGMVTSSDAYSECKEYITYFASDYADFVYTDGAYKCENVLFGATAYIKINDGNLTSLVLESVSTLAYNNYSYSNTMKYEIKFSDYGSTTVTVPEEYTYANYAAKQAA